MAFHSARGTVILSLALGITLGVTRADPPEPADAPEADAAQLAASLKGADVIFTGKVARVRPLGHTNSIPASVFGTVSFSDIRPLRGTPPREFSYSQKEGFTKNIDLTPDAAVLVAAKGKGVLAVVPATVANVALASKAVAAAEKK